MSLIQLGSISFSDKRNLLWPISTRYGDDEQTVSKSFAQRVCAGFAQLGARGTPIMFSSRDAGVGDGNPDPATQECFSNLPEDKGQNVTVFIQNFPASLVARLG